MNAAPAAPIHPSSSTDDVAVLRARLAEAEETLRAIGNGEVDALVGTGDASEPVYTLSSAGDAYRALIESMNEGALTLTTDKIILYANARFAKMVHRPLAQVIGASFKELLAEADCAPLRALLKSPGQDGSTMQLILHLGDGGAMPVLISVRRLAENGTNRMTVGMVVTDMTEQHRNEEVLRETQEITARKEAETKQHESEEHFRAALRFSEIRYRRLFETAMDGVLILDGQTSQITEANPFILEVLGITRAEVLGRELWEIGVFGDATASRAAMAELQERGYVRYDDLPLESKTGQRREVEVVANVYQEDGQRVIQCNIRDISERKQASQYARSLIEASLDPLVTISAEGKITDVNEGLIKVTGMAREKLIGTDFSNYFTEPEKAREGYRQVFAKGFVTDYPLTIRRKDGCLTDVLYNASVYKDGSGNVLGVFAAARDITERKKAEDALIEAKEHAEAASKAKDNFLAALSHELRTPLTPVLMTATALSIDPSLPAEAREQLDMMRRNIELEARLIDDLLDLTHIIHGKLIIAPVTADIHDLILHSAEIIRSDCLGKRLRVTLKLEAAQHHTLGDPARLQQVFWNLLRNAVKFTPDGGTIIVSTRNDAEGKIIITVVDDGIGIRAEVLAQIFNAFEQADTTGEHRYGGLGLGLAISSAIITAHGGEIRAESQGRGHGADFTITLGSIPSPAATSQQTAIPTQPPRSLALLVVEDHEATRTVLQLLLTHSGHLVTTAATVHDALTAYKAAHFDAVISDLGLPDGSGIDLMAQIQSIRPVPAIALSGYGMEEDLQRTREAGFTAHLVKPVNINELRRLVEQLAPGMAPKP